MKARRNAIVCAFETGMAFCGIMFCAAFLGCSRTDESRTVDLEKRVASLERQVVVIERQLMHRRPMAHGGRGFDWSSKAREGAQSEAAQSKEVAHSLSDDRKKLRAEVRERLEAQRDKARAKKLKNATAVEQKHE